MISVLGALDHMFGNSEERDLVCSLGQEERFHGGWCMVGGTLKNE